MKFMICVSFFLLMLTTSEARFGAAPLTNVMKNMGNRAWKGVGATGLAMRRAGDVAGKKMVEGAGAARLVMKAAGKKAAEGVDATRLAMKKAGVGATPLMVGGVGTVVGGTAIGVNSAMNRRQRNNLAAENEEGQQDILEQFQNTYAAFEEKEKMRGQQFEEYVQQFNKRLEQNVDELLKQINTGTASDEVSSLPQ